MIPTTALRLTPPSFVVVEQKMEPWIWLFVVSDLNENQESDRRRPIPKKLKIQKRMAGKSLERSQWGDQQFLTRLRILIKSVD